MLGVELDLTDVKNGNIRVRRQRRSSSKNFPRPLGNFNSQKDNCGEGQGDLHCRSCGRDEKSGDKETLLDDRSVDAARLLSKNSKMESREPFESVLRRNHSCSLRMAHWMHNDLAKAIEALEQKKITDGALEYEASGKLIAGIGAVLMCPDGSNLVFGTKVPERILQSWQVDGKTHVVGLVELYAAVTAYKTWADIFRNQRVICFTDSWPVLDVLVKGNSPIAEWRDLLLIFESLDEDECLLE